MRAARLHGDVGTEMAQHPFSVIACRLGFDHHRFARRREAGEQHGGLELRRGGGRLVDDRDRIARAFQNQREPAAIRDAHRTLRILEVRTQAKDHPILLTVPETAYLKCLIAQCK